MLPSTHIIYTLFSFFKGEIRAMNEASSTEENDFNGHDFNVYTIAFGLVDTQ